MVGQVLLPQSNSLSHDRYALYCSLFLGGERQRLPPDYLTNPRWAGAAIADAASHLAGLVAAQIYLLEVGGKHVQYLGCLLPIEVVDKRQQFNDGLEHIVGGAPIEQQIQVGEHIAASDHPLLKVSDRQLVDATH